MNPQGMGGRERVFYNVQRREGRSGGGEEKRGQRFLAPRVLADGEGQEGKEKGELSSHS